MFFAFAALFLVLRYWLLPNIEDYREQIVAAVSRNIDLPVKIDAIRADWRGLRPRLELENLRVFDAEGREALVLPHVRNIVSWRSFAFRDLRLHSFEVSDLQLTVRRGSDGTITVGGIRLTEQKGDGRLTDWVLGQREIVVSNAEVEWLDESRKAPPLKLSALNFRLRNDGDEHAVGFSARPPEALGSSFEARAELIGRSVTLPSAWNGRVFAEVGNTDLAAWRACLDYPIDVRAGQGALRVWATLGEGTIKRATADVVLSKVVTRLGKDLPVLELASVSGRMQGRESAAVYELAARNLRLVPEHAPELPATSFQLNLRRGTGEVIERGSVSANLIELAPLARLAGYLPFPSEMRKLLSELEPRGALLDVKFDWQGQLPAPQTFTARGRFAALGMNALGAHSGFHQPVGQRGCERGQRHAVPRGAGCGTRSAQGVSRAAPEARCIEWRAWLGAQRAGSESGERHRAPGKPRVRQSGRCGHGVRQLCVRRIGSRNHRPLGATDARRRPPSGALSAGDRGRRPAQVAHDGNRRRAVR